MNEEEKNTRRRRSERAEEKGNQTSRNKLQEGMARRGDQKGIRALGMISHAGRGADTWRVKRPGATQAS